MLQSFLTEPGKITFTEAELPVPGQGEVLIRMEMVGICGSDIQMFKHGHQLDFPLTIGHEGVGRIEAVGSGIPEDRVGERVAVEPNISCSHCPECRKGRGNICRNKRIIGVNETGCFAEYLALPADFAHRLPETIAEDDAATIEPAAVALAALKRSGANPDDAIAVIGLGTIGMLLTHVARSLGYRVLVTEPIQSKMEKAKAMGAEPLAGGNSGEETAGQLEAAYENAGVTVLFECAGTADSTTLAIRSAPRGASIVLLGLSKSESSFTSFSLSRKGNSIIPSLIYDHPDDFQQCIQLVGKGLISPGIVVARHYPLKDLQAALEIAAKGESGKIVIHTSGN